MAFWRSQPFDLGIDDSNCDLCFLKGRSTLDRLIREEPSRADWWIEQERQRAQTFSSRFSYRDLVRYDAPMLPFDDEPAVSCFCGD